MSKKLSEDDFLSITEVEANDQMVKLIRELTKARYVLLVLHIELYREGIHQAKMSALNRLEVEFSRISKNYSPTKYRGYNEENSRMAFGGKEEWNLVKNNIDFIKESNDEETDSAEYWG